MEATTTATENNPGTYPIVKRFHGKAYASAYAEKMTARTGQRHIVVRVEVFPGCNTPFCVVDARWVVA